MSTEPPSAKQVPHERAYHGDTVIDEYAWLADKEDPDTIAYLNAENAYTEAATAGLSKLQDQIFAEIKARTQESDLSVPVRKGGWWQYARTVEGQQYAVHCRRAVRPGEVIPPLAEDGQPLDGEEVLLDDNELAAGAGFFALGAYQPSPDWRWLAYSTDFSGDERFTIRIKDLATGALLPDEIPGAFYGCSWSLDGSALFYVTVDDAWRPYRVWRHRVGTPAEQDDIVFEEADRRFHIGVGTTRSERYVVIRSASVLTSEVWLLDAADAGRRIQRGEAAHAGRGLRRRPPRRPAAHPAQRPRGELRDRHRAVVRPGELDPAGGAPGRHPAAGHGRVRGLHRGLLPPGRADRAADPRRGRPERDLRWPEPIYRVAPGPNPEYDSGRFRLSYTSLVTPGSVYDCDMATGELTLLKRQPVLPSPSGEPYRPEDYEQHREWAVSRPTAPGSRSRWSAARARLVTVVLHASCTATAATRSPATRPSPSRCSRCSTGGSCTRSRTSGAAVRWAGPGTPTASCCTRRTPSPTSSACAEHLEAAGWTSASRLVARGGSAGGLLMGAVANLAPQDFAGIVAHVPFVDALNTILDPSLPLTVTEWEEWGDPLHDPAVYAYMKSYTPYENVTGQVYPPIFALGGLNDTRVTYHEPAKWVARLRAVGQGGPFLLKIEMEAGHGGRSGRYDAWREEALVLAWVVETAGGSPTPSR